MAHFLQHRSGAINGPCRAVVRDRVLRYRRVMNAVTALDKQIERYRQMTGEQRLKVALELHELSCDIAREAVRRPWQAITGAFLEAPIFGLCRATAEGPKVIRGGVEL